jgi:hypothetical protein
MKWICGWNRSGFPREMEPIECDSWGDAAEAVHDELTRRIDAMERAEGNFTALSLRVAGTDLLESEDNKRWDYTTKDGTEFWIEEAP